MDTQNYSFIKSITIDLVEVEFYKNSTGQYKTICTFLDCEDKGREQFYANFEELYDVFSDYIDNQELIFEPCVMIFNHSKKHN